MASNLLAIASNLLARASNLRAVASNLLAVASNLRAIAPNLRAMEPHSIGFLAVPRRCYGGDLPRDETCSSKGSLRA